MGQYQQWLYAQEMDRRLKTEVESLETELLYLKDRIAVLEQTLPETENVILHALLAYQQNQAEREQHARARTGRGVVSGPLPSWDGLPSVETPQPPAMGTAPYYFGQRSEQGLLPGDMLAFFSKREQANPGQRQQQRADDNNVEKRPIDEETRVQNENVRRWFERWHREIDSRPQPEGWQHEQ